MKLVYIYSNLQIDLFSEKVKMEINKKILIVCPRNVVQGPMVSVVQGPMVSVVQGPIVSVV